MRVCRRFVVSVLSRLVRLSYWSRVQSVVPATFHALLPPEPKVPLCFPALSCCGFLLLACLRSAGWTDLERRN